MSSAVQLWHDVPSSLTHGPTHTKLLNLKPSRQAELAGGRHPGPWPLTHAYSHIWFSLNSLIQTTFGRTKIHLNRMATTGDMYEQRTSWAQEQGPFSRDSPPLPAPTRVAHLPVDDTIPEPDTGHSFARTGLISASTYTPSYLRKTPTDYHLFLNVSKLLSFPRRIALPTAVQTPLRCTSSSWTDPELSPTGLSHRLRSEPVPGKRHLCPGRGSHQQAAPKWRLKLHPTLCMCMYVHVCARVCVHRQTGAPGNDLGQLLE